MLLILDDKPPADIARELDIKRNQLYKWQDELKVSEGLNFDQCGDLVKEIPPTPFLLADEALQGKWYDWEVIAQSKIKTCLMRHVHSN